MFEIDKFLVGSTELFLSVFVLYGMSLSFFRKTEAKFSKWILHTGLSLGLVAGLIQHIIRLNQPKRLNILLIKWNRQLIVIIALCSLLTLLFMSLRRFLKKSDGRNYDYFISIMLSFTLFFALFYLSPIGYKMTGEFVYFGEDSMSTMALLRAIGFALGIAVCLACAFLTVQVSAFLSRKQSYVFLSFAILSFSFEYVVKAISAMQRMKWIELNDFVFNIMIFGDKYGKFLTYAMLAVVLFMLLFVTFKHRRVTGEFANPALHRKAKAYARSAGRYSLSLFFCMGIAVFIMTIVHYYSTKEVELTPPQAYSMQDNFIVIPLSDIDDGHLHRFSYQTANGYDVRFIAVKKLTGNAYGLGLDACEICGIAGYYERGDEVICKRCDVVMNKNTIGFKGGCNPIPFPYEIKDKKIYIDVADLIREEKRFK